MMPHAVPVQGWDGVNNLFREGEVYFGGQPDSASFVRFAREAGVSTIVNIRRPEELDALSFDEPALVEGLGMQYVNLPVTPETLSRDVVDSLDAVLESADGGVLIHCGSSNRVGGTWATHLFVNEDLSLEEAIARGEAAGLRSPAMYDAVERVAEQEGDR